MRGPTARGLRIGMILVAAAGLVHAGCSGLSESAVRHWSDEPDRDRAILDDAAAYAGDPVDLGSTDRVHRR